MQAFLEGAVATGNRPRKTPTESVILRRGGEHRVLVTIAGSLTKAGRAYQEITGETLEAYSYDPAQTPARRGNVESIKMKSGKDSVVRTCDPATTEYNYTSLGKRFFKDTRREYIVKVPAKFEGVRADGRRYERTGYFPIHDPISVRMTWNRAQRDAFIKMSLHDRFTSDNVIAEFSEEELHTVHTTSG